MNERMIDTFRTMTLTGKAAVLIALTATAITIWSLSGLVSTLLGPSFDARQLPTPNPEDAVHYLASIEADHQFIDHKSSFFKPKAPEDDNTGSDTNDQASPPVIHSTYGGPKLMGLSGITAYFDSPVIDNENNIKVGRKGGKVELIRILPPFKAIVKWENKNWTLDLMKTKFSFTTAPSGVSQPITLQTGGRTTTTPFTTRGSSPNTNPIFGEADNTRPARGSTVPARRPPRNGRRN